MMADVRLQTLLCLGIALIAAVNCRSFGCPSREDIGCVSPLPCPPDRPYLMTSYITSSQCPACQFCVESLDTCPSLPCPMIHVPEGCSAELFGVEIRVDETVCWECHNVKLTC
ncbi:uncharacterized protein LOC123551111 [Mercenaria mercenaria]|uniref:uncharacterized protein LOC123551111 n=1 Tax=Mercenaria mercenaria TaxID=6596 RepID=UPI00234F1760|nr:uncharacterized protein LOC123551111 [Mercenaria mercenaria]